MQTQLSNSGFDPQDAQQHKVVAALGYIIFLIPLLLAKDSRFAKFHANQGLLLLIVSLVANIVLGMIPIIGWIVLPIANLLIFILAIMGILGAVNGQTKPLPFFGKIQLIK